MIFSTSLFLLFFSIVFIIYWLVLGQIKNNDKKLKARIIFLLLASYYFYMSWNPVFILLILFSTVVDYLKTNAAKNKYLLLTPFWHIEKKSADLQKDQYEKLVKEVKSYCKQNNVTCIDASYILNKDNFGVYTNGNNKDKIDVLHFNA